MNREEFWGIIDVMRAGTETAEEQAAKLTTVLADLEPERIAAFQTQFDECMNEMFRWDVWGVAWLLKGGCSDDAFVAFRAWLISQDREVWDTFFHDPQEGGMAVLDQVGEHTFEAEPLLASAARAHEQTAGGPLPDECRVPRPPEPRGEAWDENDVWNNYPRLGPALKQPGAKANTTNSKSGGGCLGLVAMTLGLLALSVSIGLEAIINL